MLRERCTLQCPSHLRLSPNFLNTQGSLAINFGYYITSFIWEISCYIHISIHICVILRRRVFSIERNFAFYEKLRRVKFITSHRTKYGIGCKLAFFNPHADRNSSVESKSNVRKQFNLIFV